MEFFSGKKLEKYLDTKRLALTDADPAFTQIESSLSAVRKFIDVKVLNLGPSKIVAKDDLPVY